mgnify:CR=1 FL=1
MSITNNTINQNTSPDFTSCAIQQTSDQQLNANLANLVKVLIGAMRDGTIAVKNAERLQNLTVNDILELAKKNSPVQDINNYITQNGTNIVEVIESHSISRDTKFVTTGFIPFKIITRKEIDPSDPTGTTKIDVPYIRAKLPYDLVNKDRIVQVYLTTKNDSNQNLITNDVLFEYDIWIDSTDPKAAYVIETRADKIQIGKTKEYNVTTYPQDPTLWGTWSDEKYIKVTHLVDSNWIIIPPEDLPDTEAPNVAVMDKPKAMPMNYGLGTLAVNDLPTESVNILKQPARIISYGKHDDLTTNHNQYSNFDYKPQWIILEDPAHASDFMKYTKWLATASRVLEQKSKSFTWSPDGGITESANILIMPNNKVINQFTYNLAKQNYINWGSSIGLNTKIIEMVTTNIIDLQAESYFQAYGSITGHESEYGLMVKLNDGEQYPFIQFQVKYIPARIISLLTSGQIAKGYANSVWTPIRIIEEILTYLNPLNFRGHCIHVDIPTRVINYLHSVYTYLDNCTKVLHNPTRIIAENTPSYKKINNGAKENNELQWFRTGTKIISEEDFVVQSHQSILNNVTVASKIISPDLLNTLNKIEAFATNDLSLFGFTETNPISLNKLFLNNPTWVINQESLYPMSMTVSSGSVYYIQDMYNMRVVSSLANKEDLVPLITAEGRQQRSEYEFYAEQDQRVFDVKHNTDLVTVYRQGFKLSHGDYYANGSKIILKSPANAGEVINVISERRFVYANTVSKEDLDNALAQLKTETPIITYPGVAYENTTAEIKIHNYDPTAQYSISIKYEGTYRDDIMWAKRNNIIVVSLPEIDNVARRTLSVAIYAHTSGKLQSKPTEALINIKNLFDVSSSSTAYRLIYGAVPTEWYGMENTQFHFDDMKTPKSTYGTLNAIAAGTNPIANPAVPARIGIPSSKWYQTKLLKTDKFKGSYLDTFIGLENLANIKLDIISSDGSETVFGTPNSNYLQPQIEAAFEKGTLYFIVDGSTAPNDSNFQVPNGPSYGKLRYSYRPALEYTSVLNLLPRTEKVAGDSSTSNTWYLEHNNGLKGRIIHAAIIVDFDLIVDYDFDSFANISEDISNPNLVTTTFPLENIKYQVQDNIPFLLGTINNPKIPFLTNPYINIGSKVSIKTDNQTLNDLQTDNLLVNNIYAERIFSGLHTSLITKDNFTDTQSIMNISKRYKKFYPFSPGTLYETPFKKDFFMLNEEDQSEQTINSTKTAISMARFLSDQTIVTDNPTYSARVKELAQVSCLSDTFKCLYQVSSEDYNAGSTYQANLGLVHYGGSADYVIDTSGTSKNVIEHKIAFQKIYIKNSETITSGKVPTSVVNVKDGYHVIVGDVVQKRIPTFWDVVLRPSVRSARTESIKDVWYLIRDNITLDDNRWLQLTSGILRKPKVVTDSKLTGNIHREHEVVNIPDKSEMFLLGGEGYEPTLKMTENYTVSLDYLTSIDKSAKYYAGALRRAYNNRWNEQGHWDTRSTTDASGKTVTSKVWIDDGGWKGRTDIIGIVYGWENGEPYVEYAWGRQFFYWAGSGSDRWQESGIKFYIHRVSRAKCVNKFIYHIDLSKLYSYNPGDNDIYPSFITRIKDTTYETIFDHPTDVTKSITNMGTNDTWDRPNFIDTIYESGAWWFVIKQAFSKVPILCKMNATYSVTGDVGGGINVSNFSFEKKKNLGKDNSGDAFDTNWDKGLQIDTNYSKWSLVPDITKMLRGDGPILVKHNEATPLLSGTATVEPGIYYYDTWDGYLYKKAANTIPVSSILFGLHEVDGIRNPYIIQLDPDKGIEDKIDIVGSRFFIVMYLDTLLTKLSKDQFLQLKEELLNIDAGTSTSNPTKDITIYNNIVPLKVRAILPDGDDYRSNSAQILMERISTQTGRPATDFVFRLTNNNSCVLELDSIRFQTV